MDGLVVGLAVTGLVIAAAFTAAFYWPESPLARLLPRELCGFPSQETGGRAGDSDGEAGSQGCGSVIHTPGARIFGVPNSVLGVLYYLVILWPALVGFPRAYWSWLIPAAWFTVAVGVYLGYRLLRVERLSCRLCWTVHAINLLLAIVLTASCCLAPAGLVSGAQSPP